MAVLRRHPLRAALFACAVPLCCASAALAAGEPVNSSPPELTQSGTEVSTTDGEWVGETLPFTYEWLRCSSTSLASCSPLQGEEDPTYTLRRADVDSRIRSRVTASNAAGSAAEPSEALGPVGEDVFPEPDPEPEPEPARPALLSPRPVVVIAGLRRGRFTFVNELSVSGPRGALVRVGCRGRGCPVKRISTSIGRRKRVRLRRAQRTYPAGAVLEIRVLDEEGERIGKFTRVRFRGSGLAPRRSDACLEPGARRPSPCP